MRSLSRLLLFILLAGPVTAQDSIRTEVFVLSTSEPGSFSFIKKMSSPLIRHRTTKLEVRSNQPSVFKIEGINPLRYRYYINNEAVTQFMESSALTLNINTFTNGDYFVTAPEIKVPEIFKTDSISAKTKAKLQEFADKRHVIEDSISKASARLTDYTSNRIDTISDYSRRQMAADMDSRYRVLYAQVENHYEALDKNDRDYYIFIGGLPLSNPKYAILEQYKKCKFNSGPDIDSIKSIQQTFALEYNRHTVNLKSIDSILQQIEVSGLEATLQNALMDKLRYYSFSWTPPNALYSYRFLNSQTKAMVRDLRQQILNKRFQLYQEFVVEIATRIGVLIQNKFRQYSSLNNELENVNSIDDSLLTVIRLNRDTLINTFAFIQQTSAELQVMVSYLDINTELYQNIAKKINNNYVFLLAYLKNLEFLVKQNTVQYTLPTHTNLKNIDLIRYTIKREDKITKNTQSYSYDFWVRGGIKVDFSIGLFASRLTDNLYSKVLLDTLGGRDSIRITRQDDGRANFAFGGMVHITPRNGASWVNIGGSIGVAYSNNQKLQVLTGLSLHFGKTERLVLNGGIAMGTIKTLDISANNFLFYNNRLEAKTRDEILKVREKDRVYVLNAQDIKFSSYVIPVVEKFVIRPFIGFSYNLSRKNALQAVSGAGVSSFNENYRNAPAY